MKLTRPAPGPAYTGDWRTDAACAGLGDEMFPQPTARMDVEYARGVCLGCPVMIQCGIWALEQRVSHGVWGGLSEGERRTILANRNRRRYTAADPESCGTRAGHARHLRHREAPCQACRQAAAPDEGADDSTVSAAAARAAA